MLAFTSLVHLILAQAADPGTISSSSTISLGLIGGVVIVLASAIAAAAVGLHKANEAHKKTEALSDRMTTAETNIATLQSDRDHMTTALNELKETVKDGLRDLKHDLEQRQNNLHERINDFTGKILDGLATEREERAKDRAERAQDRAERAVRR